MKNNHLSEIELPKILLVDDRKQNLIALEAILEDSPAILIKAYSGNDALASMLEHDFALILLDVQMPGMDGFEVAELMRANNKTKFIPIIFTTAISKEQKYIFKGYESGAVVDYLFKPIDPVILKCKVKVFVELWKQRQELELTTQALQKANKTILEQQEELRRMAIHDYLTGLYQRRWFDEVIQKEFAGTEREGGCLTLALLDIDYFKKINDGFGHAAGDEVLKQLAGTLAENVRLVDTVFRFGGEEFVILMPKADLREGTKICERIRSKVEDMRIEYQQTQHKITISIGLAETTSTHMISVDKLLHQADEYLYQAKAQGRNCLCYKLGGGK